MRPPLPAHLLATLTPAVALALTARPAPLVAQDRPPANGGVPVSPGAVVRVRGRELGVGAEPATVVEQHGDTLVLRLRDGGLAFVPLDRVRDLEVARGQRPRSDGAWQGARVGALVLGVPSVALTVAAVDYDRRHRRDGCSDVCIPATPLAVVAGTVLTGVATLAGAAIGAAVSPRERWEHVTPPVRVGIAPVPGGTAVALSLRF